MGSQLSEAPTLLGEDGAVVLIISEATGARHFGLAGLSIKGSLSPVKNISSMPNDVGASSSSATPWIASSRATKLNAASVCSAMSTPAFEGAGSERTATRHFHLSEMSLGECPMPTDRPAVIELSFLW